MSKAQGEIKIGEKKVTTYESKKVERQVKIWTTTDNLEWDDEDKAISHQRYVDIVRRGIPSLEFTSARGEDTDPYILCLLEDEEDAKTVTMGRKVIGSIPLVFPSWYLVTTYFEDGGDYQDTDNIRFTTLARVIEETKQLSEALTLVSQKKTNK